MIAWNSSRTQLFDLFINKKIKYRIALTKQENFGFIVVQMTYMLIQAFTNLLFEFCYSSTSDRNSSLFLTARFVIIFECGTSNASFFLLYSGWVDILISSYRKMHCSANLNSYYFKWIFLLNKRQQENTFEFTGIHVNSTLPCFKCTVAYT